MATSTGTATSHTDLWSKLDTFLTSGLGSQNWTKVWTATNQAVFRGPGLAGGDQVFVGMRLVSRPTPDEYEIELVGMSGIIASATSITDHVNVSPHVVRLFLDSGPMTYWLVGNGRRFIVVVKISTIFQAAYGGFILPYATPDQYSYPLFIGGSAGESSDTDLTSWRSTHSGHRHFVHSYYGSGTPTDHGSAWLLDPAGNWLRCGGGTGQDGNVGIGPREFFSGLGTAETVSSFNFGYGEIRNRLRAGFAGEFLLTPHTLVQMTPSDQTYGVLDGTYHVTGFGNSSENTISANGVTHLTVQDVFRTGVGDYWALALE